MAHLRLISILILVPFLALTAYAVWDVGLLGLLGIPEYHLHSSAGWQVFIDLVIACLLLLFFLVRDAKAKGINPWPWVIGTLFTGSIAPLVYFALFGGRGSED